MDGFVSEVMRRGVPVVAPETTIAEVAREMRDNDTAVVFVGTEERVTAAVTADRLVIDVLAVDADPGRTSVSTVATPFSHVVEPDEALATVSRLMLLHRLAFVPVAVRDDVIIGLVSLADVGSRLITSDPSVMTPRLGRV